MGEIESLESATTDLEFSKEKYIQLLEEEKNEKETSFKVPNEIQSQLEFDLLQKFQLHVQHGEFKINEEDFIEYKSQLNLNFFLKGENTDNDSGLSIQKENFMKNIPGNYLKALTYISYQIKEWDMDYRKLVEVVTSRSMLGMVNQAHEYLVEQERFLQTYDKMLMESGKSYYMELMRMMKTKTFMEIKKKAGYKSFKEELSEEFQGHFKAKQFPEHVQEIFKEQMIRFMEAHEQSKEFLTIKSQLEAICELPFGIKTQDKLDVAETKRGLGRTY
jgi:ATP-dependent Lon protease